ncbi:hypothetical protein GJB61_09480 [Paenibacillus sp. LC-T2]|uniref:Uncharacterized protein n=1 Tax=Paenibacillus monticola TaxID=2666075 RepID=A0A7X2H474_9BACL|nr:hypothetical protein [Paenibacillus monticola]
MPTFDNVLVTGNQTIQGDLHVNGNETIDLSLQVNGSQSIAGHLGVTGEIDGAGTIKVGTRLISLTQATVPASIPSTQQVRFFPVGISNQPGLILKGTDGNDYVLFIDLTGGTPHIGIHLA